MTEPTRNNIAEADPISLAAWSVVLLGGTAVFVLASQFLIPLAIAIIFWVLLDALRDLVESVPGYTLPNWVATSSALLILFVVSFFFINILLEQAGQLEVVGTIYQARFEQMLENVRVKLGLTALPSAEAVIAQVNIASLLSWLGDSLGVFVSDVLLVVLYLSFLLAEEEKIPPKIRLMANTDEEADKFLSILEDIRLGVKNYLGVKTLVSACTGLLAYLLLHLVGVDLAAFWALLIFLLNFIPNIGSIIGTIFPALVALIQFDTAIPALIVILGVGGINFFIGNVVEPNLMGRSLNLSPFMILLSLSFWGLVWGLPGMFLAVPMSVIFCIMSAHISALKWLAIAMSRDGKTFAD